MVSKIKQALSNLDLRLYIFSSNKLALDFGDKVYIKGRIKGVRAYSPLIIRGLRGSNDRTEYHLIDENDRDIYVDCDSVYPYKGQDLKMQKIYDIVSHTFLLAILAVGLILLSVNYDLSEYPSNRYFI